MTTRNDLLDWIVDALKTLGRKGTIASICKHVWDNHEQDLRNSKSLLYTWQYDIRWAALKLRHKKILKRADASPRGVWELA